MRFAITLASLLTVANGSFGQSFEALAEVNAERARKGLRPYIQDPNLTAGAMTVAKFRAAHRIAGHSSNDFAGLPAGTKAAAAGCGVEHPGFGFLACCMFDNYQFAGAAKSRGPDGRFYFQLFVNGGTSHASSSVSARSTPVRRRR